MGKMETGRSGEDGEEREEGGTGRGRRGTRRERQGVDTNGRRENEGGGGGGDETAQLCSSPTTRHTQCKSVKSDTRVCRGKATHICPPGAHCEDPVTCKMRLTRRDQILSIIVSIQLLAGTTEKWRQNLTWFSQRGSKLAWKIRHNSPCAPGGVNYDR